MQDGRADKVTLRRVAEQANVNYGLVHRHFGTKAAVITAAMQRAHNALPRSCGVVRGSGDSAEPDTA